MSIIKLTQDLENFQWTDYSKVGTPQSFFDGHSKIVTGQKEFDRPDKQALADMESRFGPFDTQIAHRGPYGIADYMDGRQRGRGFTAPGQAPLGFTVDMESLTGGVTSQLDIDDRISLTPLSHVIAGVSSALDYGVVPSKMIMLGPAVEGAYGVNVLPISTYSSRILSREELEDYIIAPVGGRGVSYYGRLESLYNKGSMFQKEDGTYSTPTGTDLTIPGSGTEFQNFMEYGGRGIQRTFEIPREYPFHTTAYTIDTQFGRTWEAGYFPSHGSYLTDKIPIDKYASNPVKIRGELDLLFNLNWNESDNIWPYGVLGHTGPHPLIRKTVGQRYEIPGDFFDRPDFSWMALQLKRTAEDTTRINKWLETPEGKMWQEKQHILQDLNPREETRDWSRSNLIISIPPFIHATRHFGGETYLNKADFGPLIEGDDVGGFGSWLAGKFPKITGKFKRLESTLDATNTFLGGIDFFEAGLGGRFKYLSDRFLEGDTGDDSILGGINLTNLRNSSTPFGRPPKIPTQTTFSQKGAYGVGEAYKSDVNTHPLKRYQMALGGYKSLGIRDLPYHSPIASPFVKDAIVENKTAELNWEMIQRSAKVRASGGRTDEDKKYQGLVAKWVANHGAIEAEGKSIEEQQKAFDSYVKSVGKAGEITDLIGDPGRLQNALKIFDDDPSTGAGLGLIKKDVGAVDGGDYKSMATDKINIHPYGKDLPKEVDDFVKFKFKDLVNDKFIIFRAILSGISDAITPDWSGTQYIGRPDKVYVYKGAERKVSFTFEIFPKTKQEFPVLMEKLNYLIGLCYPSFTPDNRMVAPFIELTLGDMFKNTPGFLDSLSVDVDDNSPWEIDEGLQFPHHITCQCSFTYIGKYMPSTLGKHYELNWLNDTGWSKIGQTVSEGTFAGDDMTNPQRKTSLTKLFTSLEPPASTEG